MSAELRQLWITYTVKDPEQLPDGCDADDVSADLRAIVGNELRRWYNARGIDYLVCEPEV